MARVTDNITTASIFAAIGTPGGVAYEWRNKTAEDIIRLAIIHAPVNAPGNAAHRGGVVGLFKASFDWSKYGNQHILGARLYNSADHAWFAEKGRGPSKRLNSFMVPGAKKPLVIGMHGERTQGWAGNHTLRNAINTVMPVATGGSFTPLV